VRVVTAPDHEPVTSGPYRWVRHPNYVAVILEVAAVPLVHGAWVMAILGTALNTLLLRVRIRVEEAALGSSHAAAFVGRPRLIPGVHRVRDRA
jgi:methyltransferase